MILANFRFQNRSAARSFKANAVDDLSESVLRFKVHLTAPELRFIGNNQDKTVWNKNSLSWFTWYDRSNTFTAKTRYKKIWRPQLKVQKSLYNSENCKNRNEMSFGQSSWSAAGDETSKPDQAAGVLFFKTFSPHFFNYFSSLARKSIPRKSIALRWKKSLLQEITSQKAWNAFLSGFVTLNFSAHHKSTRNLHEKDDKRNEEDN